MLLGIHRLLWWLGSYCYSYEVQEATRFCHAFALHFHCTCCSIFFLLFSCCLFNPFDSRGLYRWSPAMALNLAFGLSLSYRPASFTRVLQISANRPTRLHSSKTTKWVDLGVRTKNRLSIKFKSKVNFLWTVRAMPKLDNDKSEVRQVAREMPQIIWYFNFTKATLFNFYLPNSRKSMWKISSIWWHCPLTPYIWHLENWKVVLSNAEQLNLEDMKEISWTNTYESGLCFGSVAWHFLRKSRQNI